MFADGDYGGAARALATIQATLAQEPAMWWRDKKIADAAAAEAMARQAAGDRPGAARALAAAESHYAQVGDALAGPVKARRAALVEAVRGSDRTAPR